MYKLENFLCCIQLELGGLIIGWIYFISCLLGALSCVGFIAFLAFVDTDNEMQGGIGFVIGILVFACLVCCIFAFVYYKLIKGSSSRDHNQVKPAMIFAGIAFVFSVLGALDFTAKAIGSAISGGIINGYVFLVLYSIYDMFKAEKERGFNPQYQQGGKV